MKYIISIFLCLISFTKIAFAQVLFLNTSNTTDMEITYRFCNDRSPERYLNNTCIPSSTTSITVKSRSNESEKNYVKFDVPREDIILATNMVQIVSVVEKDPSGNIMARADFTPENDVSQSSCKGVHRIRDYMVGETKDANIAFIFSDNLDLPIILCHTESF